MMNQTRWTCDVCKIKSFQTFQEALEHERYCTDATPASSSPAPIHKHNYSQQHMSRQSPHALSPQTFRLNNPAHNQLSTAAALNGGGFLSQQPSSMNPTNHRMMHPHLLHIQRQLPIRNNVSIVHGTKPNGILPQNPITSKSFSTLWTCDVCHVAEFESYELAEAHERICQGPPPPPPPPDSNNMNKTRNTTNIASAPTGTNVAQHSLMMKPADVKKEHINCYSCEKCQRLFFHLDDARIHEKTCQGTMTVKETSIKEEKKMDTTRTTNDVIDLCDGDDSDTEKEDISTSVPTKSNPNLNPNPNHDHRTSTVSVQGPSMMVTDPKSWNEKWKTSKNDTTEITPKNEASYSQVMGEYNAIKLLISASRSLDFIESDIVPMLFPKIDPLMKYVQPFYVSALSQLSLAARPVRSSESTLGDYFRVVCLQCVHCGKQNRLSTKSLSLDIINFIGSHILEECTLIPLATLRSLQRWASVSKRDNSEFPLTLNQVCDLVESYYRFSLVSYKDQKFIVVSNNGDTNSKEPDIINSPKDDDTSKEEGTSKEEINKRSLVDDENQAFDSGLQGKKRVYNEQIPGGDMPCKYVREDGKSYRLVPFGGVPLINSFTKKKAELLGREMIAVLSNLEFFNDGEAVSLRCQLCAASPKCYKCVLETVTDLPRAILESAEHLKDCPCAPASVTSLNLQSILKTKDDVGLLRELCFFIAHLTGMQDKEFKGKSYVVWGRSEYELKEGYIAKDLVLH